MFFKTFVFLVAASSTFAGNVEPWWSLQPLPPPAAVAGNVVDYYIDAKLKAEGLQPAPPADARTLVRRLYFDLTGLPPSPEEVEVFVSESDKSDHAYAALVDKLLASPRYGERVRVFDTATWTELPNEGWQAHSGAVCAIDVSNDARLIATSGDTTLKLWLTEKPADSTRIQMLNFTTYFPAAWLHFARDTNVGDRALLHCEPFSALEIWPAAPSTAANGVAR